jgi:seryl-tRNA synthetase
MRFQPHSGGRARYPSTLNGSALPIGRTSAALLEHGQQADGGVRLPEALARYFGDNALRPGER